MPHGTQTNGWIRRMDSSIATLIKVLRVTGRTALLRGSRQSAASAGLAFRPRLPGNRSRLGAPAARTGLAVTPSSRACNSQPLRWARALPEGSSAETEETEAMLDLPLLLGNASTAHEHIRDLLAEAERDRLACSISREPGAPHRPSRFRQLGRSARTRLTLLAAALQRRKAVA